jgi:hypothetical protein
MKSSIGFDLERRMKNGERMMSLMRMPAYCSKAATFTEHIGVCSILIFASGCAVGGASSKLGNDPVSARESIVLHEDGFTDTSFYISTRAVEFMSDGWAARMSQGRLGTSLMEIKTSVPWLSGKLVRSFVSHAVDTVDYLVCVSERDPQSAVGLIRIFPSPGGDFVEISMFVLCGFFNRSARASESMEHEYVPVYYYLYGAVADTVRYSGFLQL